MQVHSIGCYNFAILSLLQNQHGLLVTHIDGKMYDGMFATSSDEWRKRRRALSPAFSAHKMKLVNLVITINVVSFVPIHFYYTSCKLTQELCTVSKW